jgi:hypothetical protein
MKMFYWQGYSVIKDAAGKLIGSVTTDSDGIFRLKAKPMSTISVVINYLGFKDYNSGTIILKQENLDLGRIYMDTKSTMLEGVTVVASRKSLWFKVLRQAHL